MDTEKQAYNPAIALCPFCGEHAEVKGGERYATAWVQCTACFANGPVAIVTGKGYPMDKQKAVSRAIRAWNWRATNE